MTGDLGDAISNVDAAAMHETQLYREILALWHTALLRPSKLSVHDEIENGLDVFRRSFLAVVPRLHVELGRQLQAAGLVRPGWTLPPILRIGTWIGGDRDGNPFVNAETLNYAFARQSQV